MEVFHELFASTELSEMSEVKKENILEKCVFSLPKECSCDFHQCCHQCFSDSFLHRDPKYWNQKG